MAYAIQKAPNARKYGLKQMKCKPMCYPGLKTYGKGGARKRSRKY